MASSKLIFLAALLLISSGMETFGEDRLGPVGPPICVTDNDCFNYCGPPSCTKCQCLYNKCFCSKADEPAGLFFPISSALDAADAFPPSPPPSTL